MENNSIEIKQNNEIIEQSNNFLMPTYVETVKNSICKGFNNDEFAYFMQVASRYNLDPLSNQIYGWISGTGSDRKVNVMVGSIGMRAIAMTHPDFVFYRTREIRSEDIFEVDFISNQVLKHEPKGGKLKGAWGWSRRKGFEDELIVCWLDDYVRLGKDGKYSGAWATNPLQMILHKPTRILKNHYPFSYQGFETDNNESEIKGLINKTDVNYRNWHSKSPQMPLDVDAWLQDDDYKEKPVEQEIYQETGKIKPRSRKVEHDDRKPIITNYTDDLYDDIEI